jgi:hypothetical protein
MQFLKNLLFIFFNFCLILINKSNNIWRLYIINEKLLEWWINIIILQSTFFKFQIFNSLNIWNNLIILKILDISWFN